MGTYSQTQGHLPDPHSSPDVDHKVANSIFPSHLPPFLVPGDTKGASRGTTWKPSKPQVILPTGKDHSQLQHHKV